MGQPQVQLWWPWESSHVTICAFISWWLG